MLYSLINCVGKFFLKSTLFIVDIRTMVVYFIVNSLNMNTSDVQIMCMTISVHLMCILVLYSVFMEALKTVLKIDRPENPTVNFAIFVQVLVRGCFKFLSNNEVSKVPWIFWSM
jgi:hypothetical protein